jgi:hypothetical protein
MNKGKVAQNKPKGLYWAPLLINKQKEIDLEAISHKLYQLINYKSYFNYTKNKK